MNIGWVGLGSIGTNMVKRASQMGHAVTVYERGEGLAEVRAMVAATSPDYREIAAGCDVLGVCLFSDTQLRSVLFGEGALAAMRPGSVVAIHTTGSPALAREIAERAPAGVAVLDATFSGGPDDVLGGKLTLMIGGQADAVAQCRPLFETYADKINHVGPIGAGQMLKLFNNLLFAANLKTAAELLRIATAVGIDSREAANIIQTASGGSYAMRSFQRDGDVESALERTAKYLRKDVTEASASAVEAGADMAAFADTVAYFQMDRE